MESKAQEEFKFPLVGYLENENPSQIDRLPCSLTRL